MKKVSFTKIAVTFAVIVISVTMCVSPSWAASNDDDIEVSLMNLIKKCLTPDVVNADEDQYVEALQYIQSVWRTSLDKRKKVDYEVLNSVYSRLIVQGVPCEIVTSRGAAQGYYIKGTGDVSILNGKGRYSIKGSYFSDTSGNIFCADLPDNGKTSSSVPSTSAPTVSENTNTTYVPGPSSDLSVLTPSNELQALKYINQTAIHIANETHRIIEYLRDTERYVFRLYLNVGRVIDGLNSIISGVYRQADLLAGYLPRLDDTVNRLTDIRSASWASVDVENRILSSSIKIGSLLSSVVQNGQLQVNTSPLENRLDKLISMYSKVNSVVLDTASINGGSITDAVGGELKDVVFWGDTSEVNNTFVSADGVAYTLNDTPVDINGLTLRSVNLGSTIPSYIANDPVLYAGVWRKGTDYIISDTYNASTGEYVKRVENFVFSSDSISFDDCCYFERGGNTQLFCITLPVFPVPYDSAFNSNWSSSYRPVPYQAPFWCWENNDSNVDAFLDCFVFYEDRFLIVTSVKGALGNLRNWFCNLSPQFSFLYVPDPSLGWMPSVRMFDPSTIAIPEGNSYISSYNVRITGTYETYDSYTRTADIITAINNLQLSSGVGADLTAITTRLDTLINKTSDTVVNVVNNNTYITNVFQLDDDISVVDTTKDGVGKVSGLFKWLWNNTFKDAFSHADITKLDGLL